MIQTGAAQTEYCGTNGHVKFAGVHLILELWQARYLDNIAEIEAIFRRAIDDCGATLLGIDLHALPPTNGVSGVAILQESHISVHTWPEYEFAALDIFVCGTVDPYRALPAIKAGFQPGTMQVMDIKRGIM